jgi:hypothetical protein
MKHDMSLLRSDYEANALESCLPIFKFIDHSEPIGLGVLGLMGWRRKRKGAAAIIA